MISTPARLGDIVATWNHVRSTPGRIEKRDRIAALLSRLAPDDLRLAVCYLSGEIPQGALGVGWSTLRDAFEARPELPLFAAVAPPAAATAAPSPSLSELDRVFERLRTAAGAGAERTRVHLLGDLAERLSPDERDFLRGLLLGELRQGAQRSLVLDALATARGVESAALRRAVMFAGELAAVAEAVGRDGAAALAHFAPRPLQPIGPMLAATAEGPESALATLGPAALEWKLDGVRIQVHRDGGIVRAFSRQLRDITHLVPEVEPLALGLPAQRFVLDGEIVATDDSGRPIPFQDLMSRFATAAATATAADRNLHIWFFDVLLQDDAALVDEPYSVRRAALERLVPESHRITAHIPADAVAARLLYEEALRLGHEGVMLKALAAPYAAGRRGAQWLKVKPATTLDLVILAAEWGHGRRRGLLSNLHLGARVPDSPDRFVMLGKTFKGLTDTMLREMTEDLLALATERDDFVVRVRPERVVEIAFDAVQRSPRYDSGLALRFARVKRFRPDKSAADAATLDEVRAVQSSQTG
jgi:DNA ligase-1